MAIASQRVPSGSSRRCGRSSRHRAALNVALVALVALTRAAEAAVADVVYGVYPSLGCYRDEHDRAMDYMSGTPPTTLESCADHCMGMGYSFVGLQFGSECFCGNSYNKYGEISAEYCDMTLEDEPDTPAGGRWAISVYELPEEGSGSSAQLQANSVTGGGTTGSTSSGVSSGGSSAQDRDPVTSGQRAFTVVNMCSKDIRVGFTGGRINFEDGADPLSEANCNAWGPSAVYNPGPLGQGCYWGMPAEETGNEDRMLSPGNFLRYYLHETYSDTRWSGTVWGSTHCDTVDGCATGVCYLPDASNQCPTYVGPSGPTTKAEFTLSNGNNKDYYDVSMIDGVNLPMMIEPDDPVVPDDTSEHIQKYQCGSPGAPVPHLDTLGGCTWAYESAVITLHGDDDLSPYLRLVLPECEGSSCSICTSDSDCSSGICGVHPQRWANGDYKGGVELGSCGEHIAWVTAGGACAGGWETDVFPDSHPFFCGDIVPEGTRASMYGCTGGIYAHSGYTPGADDTACGCPRWEEPPYGLKAPSISDCVGVNPHWVELAMPWAAHQKKACPTAYTFPYDDQTSTFTCFDGEGPGSSDTYVNTQSYTITFCPGESEANMFG